jgi:hypothetical protein
MLTRDPANASYRPDGKTLTVAQQGVNANRQPVKNTLVFDKQ